MDRLTLLQDGIDGLITIMFSVISYLNRKSTFVQMNDDKPIRQMNPQAADPATFEFNRKELATDLIRKARQIEYLISVLPATSPIDVDESSATLTELEVQLQATNRAYSEAVHRAERLQVELNTIIKALLQQQQIIRAPDKTVP